MALPVIKAPVFPVELPLKGKINIRRLTTGEYKALMESFVIGDEQLIIETFSRVMTDTIEESNAKEIFDSLKFVDVEYLFLKLYSISVDSVIKVQMHCNHENENGEACDTHFALGIDINDIVPDSQEDSKIIEVSDDCSIKLKYPKWNEWFTTDYESKSDGDVLFQIIDSVFTNDEVYTPGTDFNQNELIRFIDSLPIDKTDEIGQWIDSMPTVQWTRTITCPKCGHDELINLKGLNDFLE